MQMLREDLRVGALVGANYGLIANSSVSGAVEGSDAWIGGLVGVNYGSIVNSYAEADVKGQGSVGGLVGYSGNDGTNVGLISHSYAFGDVEGRSFSGGLVGHSQARIVNSYASGSVVSAFHGGGLVGYNDSYTLNRPGGTIRNAYASGTVVGSTYLGGLVGYNDSTIDNAYASGAVIGSDGVGGLVGISADPGSVSNSYWDAAASGVAISAGGIAAMSTALQTSTATQSIYAGWSAADWSFGSVDAPKYPTLKYHARNENSITTCGGDLPACDSDLPTPQQLDIESSHGRGPLVLTGLQLSEGTLEPAFDPTKTDYELLDVPSAATTVTAMAKNAMVRISVNEQEVSMSDQASLLVALADLVQHNIVIRLTAAGHSTQTTYTIALPAAQASLSGAPIGECSLNDIDRDDDGLIEICDIEGLHAMRYQLDGSGYQTSKTSSEITAGCDEDGDAVCIGYELMQDLDFTNSAHYRNDTNQAIWTVSDYDDSMDKGWLPIGDFANPFNAIFKASDYTISNLQINRGDRDYAGLFGHIGENAKLDEVGLLDIEVRGRFVVGGLVGWNDEGEIVNSYVAGDEKESLVEGSRRDGLVDSNWIGGMVGLNNGLIINSYADANAKGHTAIGGLSGSADRESEIRNSYAISNARARNLLGGLIGINQGEIHASYAGGSVAAARGSVELSHDIVYYVGGLVGYNDNEGMIMNSYAYSSVSGGVPSIDLSGGLVGFNLSNPGETNIRGSYWDREASRIAFSSGSADANGLTMRELQSSASFVGWSEANWSFGTDEEYPRLKYAAGEDEDDPACETSPPDTELQNCNEPLSGQGIALQSIELRSAELFPDFDFTLRNYAANVSTDTTEVEVIAIASDRTELRVNREIVSSGEYKTIELDEGMRDTKITVVSISEQITTTYTIVVVRQAEEALFVQSRLAGQPGNLNCKDCNPNVDGVVRMRFAPKSVELLPNNRVKFRLQFRRGAGAVAGHYVSSAGFGLSYNQIAFDKDLNTPALDPYTMGMSQCTYERSDFFSRDNKYSIGFSDSDVDELNIAEIGRDRNASSEQLSMLGADWEDVLTMTCFVPNTSRDAGLAIAGSNPRQIELRRYDADGDAIPSLALLLADNDLRGLRLDGKTYVEDYARYGNGKGVRLKFSKGVAAFFTAGGTDARALSARNFSLRETATADTEISMVTHRVGSPYVEVEFNQAVARGELRLSSMNPFIIRDVDETDEGFVRGGVLAPDNFVAELAYDAGAPVVESIEQMSTTTWSITFDKPIQDATASKENLCLTNEIGVCPDEMIGTSITSVSLTGEDKVLQMEIGNVEQTERRAAIEFRRNAILGADFKVVEGYQASLREGITIADGVPPTITVDAMGTAVVQAQTHEFITYSMSFTVSANEPIESLENPASYRLLRLPNNGNPPVPISIAQSVERVESDANRVIVRYTNIRISVLNIMNSEGFTLARADDRSLRDLSGKDPLGSDSGFLDSRGVEDKGAIVMTGDLDNTTLLASLGLSVDRTFRFNRATTEYRIMNVPNATTYTTVFATAQNPAKISHIESSTLVDDIGVNAANIAQSARIPLKEGEATTITVVVTAQNDVDERDYTIIVERLPSTDANLATLGIVSASGAVALDSVFDPMEMRYTAEVKSDLNTTITAMASHPQATLQIAKTAIAEDTPRFSRGKLASATIGLDRGTTTTVVIRVTAQDGATTEDYIVVLTRLPSDDVDLDELRDGKSRRQCCIRSAI